MVFEMTTVIENPNSHKSQKQHYQCFHYNNIYPDFSFTEQVITVLYNVKFIQECKEKVFEECCRIDDCSPYTSYDDFVYRKKVKRKEFSFQEVFKYHDVEKYIQRVKINYKDWFGWSSDNQSLISLINDIEEYGRRYISSYRESRKTITKDKFNDFILDYPQYSSNFKEFKEILRGVRHFMGASFKFVMNMNEDSFFEINLKDHIDLFNDMNDFFTPRSRVKSARSANNP